MVKQANKPQKIHASITVGEIVEYSNSNIEIHTFNQARGLFLSQFPCVVIENFLPRPSKGKTGKDAWYSPGHGDVFPSLNYSGKLNILLAQLNKSCINLLSAAGTYSVVDYPERQFFVYACVTVSRTAMGDANQISREIYSCSVSSDRISGLLEELRSKILSYLNAEEAVRASILSSIWQDMWMIMPQILLSDDSSFGYTESSPEIAGSKFITLVISQGSLDTISIELCKGNYDNDVFSR